MNQIEKKLQSAGWVVDNECPLVLGTSLLDHLESKRIYRDGTEHEFQSAYLVRAGDGYAFIWHRWDQVVSERTTLEDKKGNPSNGTTNFSPYIDGVQAGFSHVLTVNTDDSTIRFWKKEETKEVAPKKPAVKKEAQKKEPK